MQPASSAATGSSSTSSTSSSSSASVMLAGSVAGLGPTRPSGLGLARYRSAPATWLETLLEEDEGEVGGGGVDDDPLELFRPNETLTQLLSSSPLPSLPTRNLSSLNGYAASSSDNPSSLMMTPSSGSVLFRQNSSPAEFIGSSSFDGMFSTYNAVPGGDYYYVSSSSPTGSKRMRDTEPQHPTTPNFYSQVKKEPSSSSQMPGGMGGLLDMEMDKLLEDSVPCRVRAKRGCATHPRSIAERVRRTRISDRIRKLQELVPNMDKQTNTADMLEEAVEYVKVLQNQIKELTERQSRCKCIVRE